MNFSGTFPQSFNCALSTASTQTAAAPLFYPTSIQIIHTGQSEDNQEMFVFLYLRVFFVFFANVPSKHTSCNRSSDVTMFHIFRAMIHFYSPPPGIRSAPLFILQTIPASSNHRLSLRIDDVTFLQSLLFPAALLTSCQTCIEHLESFIIWP